MSRPRRLFNVMVTFLLSGFWHGADVRFLVWGGIHGLAYLPSVLLDHRPPLRSAWSRLLGWFFTLQVVMLAWVFFRASDTGQALRMLASMGRWVARPVPKGVDLFDVEKVAVLAGFTLLLEVLSRRRAHPLSLESWPRPLRLVGTVSVFLLIAVFGNFDDVPFIYFQF